MTWKHIYKSPHNNHLFVRSGLETETYICDNSGPDPEHTDEGPLRFANEECDKIVAKNTPYSRTPEANIPVVAERDEEYYSGLVASVDLSAAILLGQRHDVDVVIETHIHSRSEIDE